MEEKHPAEKKVRTKREIAKGIGLFMYNPQTNRIMGRTPIRWGKLGLCYLVVYSFLSGLSAGMFSVFYFFTIPEDIPRLTGVHSVLDGFPGISMQPLLEDVLIYSSSNKSVIGSVRPSIHKLQKYLWNHYQNKGGKDRIQCNHATVLKKSQVCKLNMSELFPLNSECTGQESYGYLTSKPCMLVKVNKMFDWKPHLYKQKELPKDFPKSRYYAKRLAMSCYGIHPPDKENVGTINYIPNEGIDVKYYPYDGQEAYLSPFIWAQFINVTRHMILMIRCKFYAKNLGVHRRIDISYVDFQILVD